MATGMNLIAVGQSGQGTILISKILVTALQSVGRDVACTEYPAITHRFAITSTHVRVGESVVSPRIRPGEADVILGLEPFECMRVSLIYARPPTLIITNDEFIRIDGEPNPLLREPVPTASVGDIISILRERGIPRVVPISASAIALRTLRSRAGTNMVLLGAAHASGRLPLDREVLERTIAEVVPRGTVGHNTDAFHAGVEAYHRAAQLLAPAVKAG
jgi:indolepyruvate ferredoxin oxidoreductase beta subunit